MVHLTVSFFFTKQVDKIMNAIQIEIFFFFLIEQYFYGHLHALFHSNFSTKLLKIIFRNTFQCFFINSMLGNFVTYKHPYFGNVLKNNSVGASNKIITFYCDKPD